MKGPGVTGATRRRGHKPDPPGRGRTDRGFMAAEVGRPAIGKTGRWDQLPATATKPSGAGQSGDVDGCAASDPGRSLVSRALRPQDWTRLPAAQLSRTATSEAHLVLVEPPVPPITHGDVVLPGGLPGIGATGASPFATRTVIGSAAGAAGAWSATAGAASRTAVSTGGAAVGTAAVGTAAAAAGAVAGTAAGGSAGTGDWAAARCGAVPDSGRETEVRVWASGFVAGFVASTVLTRGRSRPACIGD